MIDFLASRRLFSPGSQLSRTVSEAGTFGSPYCPVKLSLYYQMSPDRKGSQPFKNRSENISVIGFKESISFLLE